MDTALHTTLRQRRGRGSVLSLPKGALFGVGGVRDVFSGLTGLLSLAHLRAGNAQSNLVALPGIGTNWRGRHGGRLPRAR